LKMKLFLGLLGVIALVLYLSPFWGKSPRGKRLERIKASPNYRDGAFQNESETPQLTNGATMPGLIKDMLFGDTPAHLAPSEKLPAVKQDLRQLPNLSLVWFGHSSYLFTVGNATFLVDPVLSDRVSPLPGFMTAYPGTTLYTPENLPAIDYLILTHDHYDHMDYSTLKQLTNRVKEIICPLGVGEHLEHWGFSPEKIKELDWWESLTLKEQLNVTATPARHFSGRGFKRNQTLWSSYVVRHSSFNLFLGGDSGFDSHFKRIGEKFGPFDLAILENGQYNRSWQYIHALPSELPQIAADLKAKAVLPVHSGKFTLARHAWSEPLETVSKLEGTFRLLTPKIGETVHLIDSLKTFEPWWRTVN
jgi:L-ascorbate metabolism protein UlaG (beta-lactamase superfamily)